MLAFVAAVTIAAGPLPDRVMEFVDAFGGSILYEFDEGSALMTHAAKGNDPHVVLDQMLEGLGYLVIWDIDSVVLQREPDPYCHPELGAFAPLPPCLPPALKIHPLPELPSI